MKIRTVTERRKAVEEILAPQLGAIYSRRINKWLKHVFLDNGPPSGGKIRALYAEALVDLLDQNGLLVVRKPNPEQVYGDEAEVILELPDAPAVELEPEELDTPEQLPKWSQHRRPRPNEGNYQEGADTPIQSAEELKRIAPAVIADGPTDDDISAHLGRGAGGMRSSLDAAKATAAADDLAAPAKVRRVIHHLAVLLRKMHCAVYVIDNADSTPDKTPTKVTMHIDLPTPAGAK